MADGLIAHPWGKNDETEFDKSFKAFTSGCQCFKIFIYIRVPNETGFNLKQCKTKNMSTVRCCDNIKSQPHNTLAKNPCPASSSSSRVCWGSVSHSDHTFMSRQLDHDCNFFWAFLSHLHIYSPYFNFHIRYIWNIEFAFNNTIDSVYKIVLTSFCFSSVCHDCFLFSSHRFTYTYIVWTKKL